MVSKLYDVAVLGTPSTWMELELVLLPYWDLTITKYIRNEQLMASRWHFSLDGVIVVIDSFPLHFEEVTLCCKVLGPKTGHQITCIFFRLWVETPRFQMNAKGFETSLFQILPTVDLHWQFSIPRLGQQRFATSSRMRFGGWLPTLMGNTQHWVCLQG